MTTAALYARVSIKDKGQNTENQLPELRRFAQAHGCSVYKEYVEQESVGTGKRSDFQALFTGAHQRRFDLVLFWSLDRFSSERGTTYHIVPKSTARLERGISHSWSSTSIRLAFFRRLFFPF